MNIFTSLRPQFHQVILPLIVVLLSFFALVFNVDNLHFERDLLLNGELWRGVTSHFLHTNINHFLLNISTVILLWALHGHYYTIVNYSVLFLVCAVTTTFGVYVYSPEITSYVGLSGVLHGVFIWGAFKDIQYKDKTGYVLLIGVVAKVIHEQLFGSSDDIATLISANVAIDAHLWGMIGGIFVAVVTLLTVPKKA